MSGLKSTENLFFLKTWTRCLTEPTVFGFRYPRAGGFLLGVAEQPVGGAVDLGKSAFSLELLLSLIENKTKQNKTTETAYSL